MEKDYELCARFKFRLISDLSSCIRALHMAKAAYGKVRALLKLETRIASSAHGDVRLLSHIRPHSFPLVTFPK